MTALGQCRSLRGEPRRGVVGYGDCDGLGWFGMDWGGWGLRVGGLGVEV
jgi:hypothetical protein